MRHTENQSHTVLERILLEDAENRGAIHRTEKIGGEHMTPLQLSLENNEMRKVQIMLQGQIRELKITIEGLGKENAKLKAKLKEVKKKASNLQGPLSGERSKGG